MYSSPLTLSIHIGYSYLLHYNTEYMHRHKLNHVIIILSSLPLHLHHISLFTYLHISLFINIKNQIFIIYIQRMDLRRDSFRVVHQSNGKVVSNAKLCSPFESPLAVRVSTRDKIERKDRAGRRGGRKRRG